MSEVQAAGPASPIVRLLAQGRPDSFAPGDWPDYPAEYGFDASHIPALIELATDMGLLLADEAEGPQVWAPTLSLRVLGQLRAEEAIAPLLRLLWTDDFFEGLADDLPFVFALIGPAAIPTIAAFLADPATPGQCTATAAESLAKIAERHPDCRDVCVAHLTHLLAPDVNATIEPVTWCVSALLDLRATESIDAIRGAFARDVIDVTIFGDLEDAEIALGLRDQHTTPRPRYQPDIMEMSTWRPSSLDDSEWDEPEEWPESVPVRTEPKIGRNALCPCGSGKKYKKCCLA